MRKLTVTEFVTLDGVMEARGGEPTQPHSGWVFDFMGKEQEQFKLQEVLEADAHLIGRVTYSEDSRLDSAGMGSVRPRSPSSG
jgi:hypothetical protein